MITLGLACWSATTAGCAFAGSFDVARERLTRTLTVLIIGFIVVDPAVLGVAAIEAAEGR